MFRALRASDRISLGWCLLAPLLVLALIVGIDGVLPATVEAGSSGGTAVSIRQRQVRAEASMRRADRQIRRLQQQRKQHAKITKAAKRKLDRAIERRTEVRRRLDRAREELTDARMVLGRKLRVHPNPSGVQVADKPALRKRVRVLDSRVERLERKVERLSRDVDKARKGKQRASRRVGQERIQARITARERSEAVLAGQIGRMLELAHARAGVGMARARRDGFRKPTRGYVSQRFGCTGYQLNPRRGSCAHFHDGMDIAAPRGSKVWASADGYVAFVGWNPWDGGKRAYVVIIAHARGFETVYGHLKPVRRVRAGQRVERGDVIGLVGLTGHTTGPHVHWEVRRDRRALHPLKAGR